MGTSCLNSFSALHMFIFPRISFLCVSKGHLTTHSKRRQKINSLNHEVTQRFRFYTKFVDFTRELPIFDKDCRLYTRIVDFTRVMWTLHDYFRLSTKTVNLSRSFSTSHENCGLYKRVADEARGLLTLHEDCRLHMRSIDSARGFSNSREDGRLHSRIVVAFTRGLTTSFDYLFLTRMCYIFIHMDHWWHLVYVKLIISVGNPSILSDFLSLFQPKCS